MKKRLQSGIVISVMVVLALLLSGCEALTRVLVPTPMPTATPTSSPAADFSGTWTGGTYSENFHNPNVYDVIPGVTRWKPACNETFKGPVILQLEQTDTKVTGTLIRQNGVVKFFRSDGGCEFEKDVERSDERQSVGGTVSGDTLSGTRAAIDPFPRFPPQPFSMRMTGKNTATFDGMDWHRN